MKAGKSVLWESVMTLLFLDVGATLWAYRAPCLVAVADKDRIPASGRNENKVIAYRDL